MKAARILGAALVLGVVFSVAPPVCGRQGDEVDIAIALDISGSMEPLIETARGKLWEIVHDVTQMEPTPKLRVALISYGSKRNDWKNGWVKVETDLTADLDVVSQRLFALEAGGGGEYLGRVLKTAVEDLDWTPSPGALKLLFIAGNERADQDPQVSFLDMADAARRKDIIVHAIFCGNDNQSSSTLWKELAATAGGTFGTINHRAVSVVVGTPFDDALADLGRAINDTFVPVGTDGAARLEAMAREDRKAADASPATVADRAEVKASPLYSAGWDLIDAVDAGKIALGSLEADQLPAWLREMAPEQRSDAIEDLRLQREDLRRQIFDLGAQREQYVASHMEAAGLDDSPAFDAAVRRALKARLEEKGFRKRNR